MQVPEISNPEDLSNHRWTVDEPEDQAVIDHGFTFNNRSDFSWNDVIQLEKRNQPFAGIAILYGTKELFFQRAKTWKKTTSHSGGNMLLSNEQNYSSKWLACLFFKVKRCSVGI